MVNWDMGVYTLGVYTLGVYTLGVYTLGVYIWIWTQKRRVEPRPELI